jgi:hypothetical protein
MEQQILKYPNHTIDNGILYRGTTTKRVINPDSEGVYKIRYKTEEFMHTLDELLRHDTPRKPKEQPKKKEDCSTIKGLCASYGIATSTYYKWLDRNYKGERGHSISKDKHTELLEQRKESIEATKGKMVKEICSRYDVKYSSYKSNIRTLGLIYGDLKKEDHEREVKDFRDRLFRKRQDSIPRMCRLLGIDYARYKGYLRKIGIMYSNLTKEGHETQLELYGRKIGKIK